jgi:hypothetical protein
MGIPQTISNRDYVLDIVDEAGVVCDRRPVSGYLTVGRGSEEFKPDLPVPDECTSASRRHAVLDLRGSRPILEDQSRFGTIVNGILLERGMTELFNGDEIISDWLACQIPHYRRAVYRGGRSVGTARNIGRSASDPNRLTAH